MRSPTGAKAEIKKKNQGNPADDIGYLAAQQLRGGVGATARFNEQIQSLVSQQFNWWIEDHAESARQLSSKPFPWVFLDHLDRRARHIAEGTKHFLELHQDESQAQANFLQSLWTPYYKTIGRETPVKKERVNLLDRLHTDHGHMARVLTVMEEFAKKTALTPERLEVLASAFEYVAEYPDVVHHPVEDQLYDKLLRETLTAAEIRHIDRVRADHREMADETQQLLRDFDVLLEQDKPDIRTIRKAVAGYVKTQRKHMADEEEHVFGLAEKYLDDEALLEASPPVDPAFDQQLSRYTDLYRYITYEVR